MNNISKYAKTDLTCFNISLENDSNNVFIEDTVNEIISHLSINNLKKARLINKTFEKLTNYPKLYFKFIDIIPSEFCYINLKLKKQKDFVLKLVEHNPKIYYELWNIPKLQNDRDIVLALVKQEGQMLGNVPHYLRNDEEIIKISIMTAPWSNYIGDQLSCDAEFMKEIYDLRKQSTLNLFTSDRLTYNCFEEVLIDMFFSDDKKFLKELEALKKA